MMKTFPASLDKLYEMLQFVRLQAQDALFDESQTSKIELALEEALVNIISYGYPNRSGAIEIHCSAMDNTGLKIVLKDRGIPYNPLTNAKRFNPMDALEAKTIGGYGVYFILKIMDEVDYTRENNFNILTLVKYHN